MTYEHESYSAISEEIRPLLRRHWEAIANDKEAVPLDVDEEKYRALDSAGLLVIITARVDGRLVGYIAAILSPHLHYRSTLFATFDVFWMEPEFRSGLNGVGLFTRMLLQLKAAGVVKVVGQSKVGSGRDVSAIYRALGFEQAEILYTRTI
jgi:hypothetical protein